METSIILSVTVGLGFVVAYLDYCRSIFKGETIPNRATWAIFAFVALLNASSYFIVTGDVWKSILPLLNIFLCLVVFVLALLSKVRGIIRIVDWIALGIGVATIAVWITFKSASWANVIVQAAILVGFIPTYLSVWKDPSSEHPRPWWIWTFCYPISATVVLMRWEGKWLELLYPVNCTILHASVPILASVRRKFMVDRLLLERELESVRADISRIREEKENRQTLNDRIRYEAIDRDSPFEILRSNGRQREVNHNRHLLVELYSKERKLQKKLGMV